MVNCRLHRLAQQHIAHLLRRALGELFLGSYLILLLFIDRLFEAIGRHLNNRQDRVSLMATNNTLTNAQCA
jgi:hypothetical protein